MERRITFMYGMCRTTCNTLPPAKSKMATRGHKMADGVWKEITPMFFGTLINFSSKILRFKHTLWEKEKKRERKDKQAGVETGVRLSCAKCCKCLCFCFIVSLRYFYFGAILSFGVLLLFWIYFILGIAVYFGVVFILVKRIHFWVYWLVSSFMWNVFIFGYTDWYRRLRISLVRGKASWLPTCAKIG